MLILESTEKKSSIQVPKTGTREKVCALPKKTCPILLQANSLMKKGNKTQLISLFIPPQIFFRSACPAFADQEQRNQAHPKQRGAARLWNGGKGNQARASESGCVKVVVEPVRIVVSAAGQRGVR